MEALKLEEQNIRMISSITNSKALGAHVSIYFPTELSDGTKGNAAGLRTLFREAEELLERSMPRKDIEALMLPFERFLTTHRWEQSAKGIALFRCGESFYHTFLGEAPPKLVVVAPSFHIKPLIHCISSRVSCVALTVTPQQISAYRIEGDTVKLLKTYSSDGDEVANKRRDRGGFIGQRKRGKEETDRFIREAARQISRDLGLRREDVAIFGPRYLRRRLVLDITARTKVDVFFQAALCQSTTVMAKKLGIAYRENKKERSQRFVKRAIRSQNESMMTRSLQEIATAAVEGRIERLMIDPVVQVWGILDRKTGLVRTHSRQISDQDDCVVDDITEEVMKKGGEVIFFDSTQLGNVAPYIATLRW